MLGFLLVAALTKIQNATPCLAAVAREHWGLCAASLTHQTGGCRRGSGCSPGSQGNWRGPGWLSLLSPSTLLFLSSLLCRNPWFFLTPPPFQNSAAKLCVVAVSAASGISMSFLSSSNCFQPCAIEECSQEV